MGHKSSKSKKIKGHLKVLILGISGSGKTTFTKQMKIIHDGFTKEEVSLYKEVLLQNIIIGIKELVNQAGKLEYQLKPENRKHARFFLEYNVESPWEPKMVKKINKLWEDNAIQQTWKAAPGYQLQMTQMDYLMERISDFASIDFEPNNMDMLIARHRTTGAQRTTFVKERVRWELIDLGGQKPEREKWEPVMQSEGAHAVIYFAALDEFNMLSSEDKTKTKMVLSMEIFSELLNSTLVGGACVLLFLNKIDLFEKKIKDVKTFKEYQKIFPDYKGTAIPDDCCDHVKTKFLGLVKDEQIEIHSHVTCALDTALMTTVFEAVKENIFIKRMELNRTTMTF